MDKKPNEVKKNKKTLTIFLLMIPALLLAMTATITNSIVRIGFQLVLLLLQYVLVKNLIEDFYGE